MANLPSRFTSGQATPTRQLKRIELVYKDVTVKFAVNPSEYTQREPNKATLTHTKGGAWIDAWGAGVAEITIRGVTGYRNGTTNPDAGYNNWIALRGMIRNLYSDIQDGKPVTDYIKLYNYTDNEYWKCYPMPNGLELSRSKSQPMMYQYTLHLWGIGRIGESTTANGIIGNPYAITAAGSSRSTSTTTSTVSGGESYITTGFVATEAALSTATTTRTKSTGDILAACFEYARQLAPYTGGTDGKLSPAAAWDIVQRIYVQPNGTVMEGSSQYAGGGKVNVSDDAILPGVLVNGNNYLVNESMDWGSLTILYSSSVSQRAAQLYNQMKLRDTNVLSPAYSRIAGISDQAKVDLAILNSVQYDCKMTALLKEWEAAKAISGKDATVFRTVLLDTMWVYVALWRMYQAGEVSQQWLNKSDIHHLCFNIQTVILMFMDNQAIEDIPYTPSIDRAMQWEVGNILHQMHEILMHINAEIVEYL